MVTTTTANAPVDEGVEANTRLTAATGAVLLVLLAAEGLTIVALKLSSGTIRWHEVLGLALIPPILLKLGTTGYRFVRYYTGDARYRRKGPPHWLLRITAPFLVLLTAVVLASGIGLAFVTHPPGWMGLAHKASFILWFGAMTVHVLGHVLETAREAPADWLPGRPVVRGTAVRRLALVAALVAGAVLAAALAGSVHGVKIG